MTREELQKSEAPKFRSRRARLPAERASTEFVPAIVGGLSLSHGIWWTALYRDREGAADFLDAAAHHLGRAAAGCAESARGDAELYECFSHYRGLFFAQALLAPEEADWRRFDASLAVLARASELASPAADVGTPLTLSIAGLAALGKLHGRSVPPVLVEATRSAAVSPKFRKLLAALVGVIDDPGAESCAAARKAYRAAVSISDYRAALVHGLTMEDLLTLSSVAECGDVVQGALNIFE